MAYTKTTWENREVEKPRTYNMTNNADGTITLTPAEGTVFAPGTPIEATVMNKMEDGIAANDAAIQERVSKTGDVMTGDLQVPTLNATVNLQEAGQNLVDKYQAKGNYAPADQYAKWISDINGVRINCGNFAGTGKPVILYLTTGQPSASSAEHRVWIQIDNF